MGKNNNLEAKSLALNSHTDISYNNLPNNVFDSNISDITENSMHEPINSYEEVNDYSFLNVITEEITSLDSVKGFDGLKEIVKGSLVDIGSNGLHNNIISDNKFTNIANNLDNSEYKALLHSIDNVSYLELIDQNNDSYSLHLQHDGYYKLDAATSLDTVLTQLIENEGNKG